jgi:hypothetical protein
MKIRLTVLALVASLAALALTVAPVASSAPGGSKAVVPAGTLTTTLTGTATDATGAAVGTVSSVLDITSFSRQGRQVMANGTLTSTITNTATGATQTVTQPISAAVTGAGTCQILHLTLGPLDLNLLGLQVHLNQVVLDITAVPGAGNLLGNLLCAVAGLLDNPAVPAGGISALLNQILGILAGLGL